MEKKIFEAGQICRILNTEGKKSKEVYLVLQYGIPTFSGGAKDGYILISENGTQIEYQGDLSHARTDNEFLLQMKEIAIERAKVKKALAKMDTTIEKSVVAQRKFLSILTEGEFLLFAREQLEKKAYGYSAELRIYNGFLSVNFKKEDYGFAERICSRLSFMEKEYDGEWMLATDAESDPTYKELLLKGRAKMAACSDKGGFSSTLMDFKREEQLDSVGDAYKGNLGYFDRHQGRIALPRTYTKEWVKELAQSIKFKK